MQSLSEKRELRLKHKKQKLIALVNLTKHFDSPESDPKRLKVNVSDDDNEHEKDKITHASDEEQSEDDSGVDTTQINQTNAEDEDEIDIDIGAANKLPLTDEQYKQFKILLDKQRDLLKNPPKLRLREHGQAASLSLDVEMRIPIFLTDVQHLIMYSLLGSACPYSPARWCQVEKGNKLQRTNVLIIENMSFYHYQSNESSFPHVSKNFEVKLEMLTPKLYSEDSIQELATVSLSSTQLRKYLFQHGPMEVAAENSPEVFDFTKNVFPISNDQQPDPKIGNTTVPDKFPRTDILLSGWQMIEENFPLPIKGLWERKYQGYVFTKDTYSNVTPTSPMFGLDCEMCKTCDQEMELTRVSLVNENYEILYDELVKPDKKIVDYLTRYSGITPKLMKAVTTKLHDVQEALRRLLPSDAIIVGQSVSNDFHALKMMHPYIIDTSVIFNITGTRGRKTKLKTLLMEFLSERIQEGNDGHCSTEDSIASLKLAKLKLSKDLYFGDAVMSDIHSQISQSTELGAVSYATSMFKQVTKNEKRAYIVATKELALKYSYFTFKKTSLMENNQIIVKEALSNDEVIEMMRKQTNSSLALGHIKLANEELDSEIFTKVDHWVEQMYVDSQRPSMNIVIFTGGKETGNGCCFINVRI